MPLEKIFLQDSDDTQFKINSMIEIIKHGHIYPLFCWGDQCYPNCKSYYTPCVYIFLEMAAMYRYSVSHHMS